MRISFKQIIFSILIYSFFRQCIAVEVDVLPPEKWPITVKQTVAYIISRLPEEDKERVRDTTKANLIMYHHGWGTGIRNYYGLWRGNKKLIIDACGEICHPDDASMKIIEAVWQELQEK